MLKSGFQPCTIACKNWNQNVQPLSVKGPLIYPISLPVLAWEIRDVCVQALSVPALKTVGAGSNFKLITPATEATSAYFNILLFPSQIKFSSTRTRITSKISDFLPNQKFIIPPCSWRKTRKTLWLTTWPDFYGEMSQPKEVQVTCTVPCFHNLLKRIFVHVNRQRLFSTKRNLFPKWKKKRTPQPREGVLLKPNHQPTTWGVC